MRTIVFFILVSIFISCQNKHEIKLPISYNDSLCNAAEKLADEDFQKSKLRLFAERITGIVYDSLLLSDYGIHTYEGTKRDDSISSCYQDIMDSLLAIKFNQSILLSTYRKSQKIEYENRAGISPDDLEIIDLSDQMQETYLGCFINLNSNKENSQEARNKIKQLLLDEGLNSQELGIKLEIDTNGFVALIHSKIHIDENIKTLIVKEMNKNGEIGYFEMEGKRKKFMVPVYY